MITFDRNTHLHPPPSAITPKGYLLPEFYSGATGLTGRFNEGFLLRRLPSEKGRTARAHAIVIKYGRLLPIDQREQRLRNQCR